MRQYCFKAFYRTLTLLSIDASCSISVDRRSVRTPFNYFVRLLEREKLGLASSRCHFSLRSACLLPTWLRFNRASRVVAASARWGKWKTVESAPGSIPHSPSLPRASSSVFYVIVVTPVHSWRFMPNASQITFEREPNNTMHSLCDNNLEVRAIKRFPSPRLNTDTP